MSAITIKIDTAEAEALFVRLAAQREATEALNEMVAFGVAEAQMSFSSGTDPYGVKWDPLTHATLLARYYRSTRGRRGGKRRARGSAPISVPSGEPLRDTGLLMGSIHGSVSGYTGIISASREYAGAHQFGTKIAGRNHSVTIPQRSFLPREIPGLPPSWRTEFETIMTSALARIVNG